MGINFHDGKNRYSYTSRKADQSWKEALKNLVAFQNISKAADIGCGGGIYSKALSDLGVADVTGVDYSETILEGARENCKEYQNLTFIHGNAFATGLKGDCFGLVLERALIHHITDLSSCFKETHRILRENGIYIIQDRTPEDCLLEGDKTHIRGYFFELFPRLIEKETKRRHSGKMVLDTLKEIGFRGIEERKLWEIRNVYDTKDQLLKDLRARTGRSILHELNDQELNQLIHFIDDSIEEKKIIEKDRWTIWKAVK